MNAPGPSSREARAPRWATRGHRGWFAFLGHRLSGIALAVFLPLHFLALGLALDGAARLDRFLAFADLPLVKLAEWGLVTLLALHLFFGTRLLLLEFGTWRTAEDLRLDWIVPSAVLAGILGAAFVLGGI